ncbi:MAG: hypothetical protein CM15mP123_07220 [Gammaproteobacteria bacterium]|jgi:hypothetical protein|nr:MAG: hypothetical protein CM15mP123_07220 [Gammaproteobacteria bacterium]|tara:strand:- start:64 stop:639 length:576 start_codon:yes stop_codon:yes gene_type:complete
MRIFLFLTFTVLVFVAFFVFKESIYKKENDVLLEKEISNEIEEKILDLTSLSNRISKKNIYLNLEKISRDDLSTEVNNLLAINKVINFDESFADIIPGDILNINLFGGNFQKEIKSVKKSNLNKIITTMSEENENESFFVIGEDVSFGKIHYGGKVFLLKKDSNLSYIINTSDADLEVPQFSDDDYSVREN